MKLHKFFNRNQNEVESDVNNIPSLKNDLLLHKYSESVDKYAKSVDAPWKLSKEDVDDIMTIADERDYLHQIINELKRRNLEFDTSKTRNIDQRWQAQLLDQLKATNYIPIYAPLENVPKTEWWWWFEILDRLTDMQLSTL